MTELALAPGKEKETVIDTVSILAFDGEKILAVRNGIDSRQNYGSYNLPGGRIEEGETPQQAAVRELKEETGLETNEAHLVEFPGNLYSARISLRAEESDMTWRVFLCIGYKGELKAEGRDGQKSIPEWMSAKDLTMLVETLPNISDVIHNAQQFIQGKK